MKTKFKHITLMLLSLCLICTAFFSTGTTVFARDSESTRRGTTLYPLYWTAYEQCYMDDAPLTQARWKDNVDWVAENLLEYGYNMVTTDGWVYDGEDSTVNGYNLKYSDDWTYDWEDMVDYADNLGLDVGVYYNPLWIPDPVYNDPTKTVIGTNIPISDIYDSGFADVAEDGAEEYIKGYVNYFKDMGIKFLRVDFLCWYESGDGSGSTAFGTTKYATALKWIHEAAGDDMQISLVMPNSFNHAENEILYGDMMRIDTDTTNGDWTWLNEGSFGDERQTWNSAFCQWANPFQGFTGFSDVGGRGNLTLDGDFLRIHNFTGSYADSEKRSAISLFTMAGSPLAVADQYDTIGTGNLAYYTNPEILALKKEGFVGKPIYYNGNAFEPATSGQADTGSRDSERWIGQTSNGDWVVALFNRSDNWVEKDIDFDDILGLPNGGYVHDIWDQSNSGLMTEYDTWISPHDVVMFRITPASTNETLVRYEAEVASYREGAHFNNDHTGNSGMGFVDNLSGSYEGANVMFGVYADYAGSHEVTVAYANNTGNTSTGTIYVHDIDNDLTDSATLSFSDLSTWNDWSTVTQTLTLDQGLNLITVARESTNTGAFNLDYIEVSDANLSNPGFESGSTTGWTVTGAYSGVDSNDVNSGSYKCYFYNSSAFTQKIDQTVSLPNGSYLVSAMVKQSTGTPTVCRMELSSFGGTPTYVNIPNGSSYSQISEVVTVSNGQINIAFYENASGEANLQIDDVSIVACGPVQNYGFEAGSLSGWTATGTSYGVDTGDAYQGDYKCYFWNSSSFTQKIEQTVTGLSNGIHTVTAWVKQDSGTPTICRMELTNYGGATVYSNVPQGSSYVQISGQVYVTNGQVTIAFY